MLWRRDLAAAHKHFKTVQKNAQSPADDKEVERLDIMLDNLDKFWKALRDAVAKLHTGDELELKDNRVAVVEASRDELMIHIYGRQQRYAIQALPTALIKALVNSSFSPTPGTKVIVGTFLAMDKEGIASGPAALGKMRPSMGSRWAATCCPSWTSPRRTLAAARGRKFTAPVDSGEQSPTGSDRKSPLERIAEGGTLWRVGGTPFPLPKRVSSRNCRGKTRR